MKYVDSIKRASARIADLVNEQNASTVVPSCPDWTLRELVIHLGEVHEWWAANIREANPEKHWEGVRTKPASPESSVDWFRAQTAALVSAISESELGSPCWTWWEAPRTLEAVARHQVQEAEIHRWDAENAVGEPNPIPLEISVDGISEFLSVHRSSIEDLDLPGLRFEATDSDEAWIINPENQIESTTSASASDLVLFLNGRLGLAAVGVSGSRSGLEKLVAATPEINS